MNDYHNNDNDDDDDDNNNNNNILSGHDVGRRLREHLTTKKTGDSEMLCC